ncbi:MAG: superoxide dismutase family protein, partial [Tistlia sp.]
MFRAPRSFLLASAVAFGAAPLLAAAPALAQAPELEVPMHLVDKEGVGKQIGSVTLADSADGLLLHLSLSGALPPGAHGFHIHETGSCESSEKDGEIVPAGAAGGHWDPEGTGRHYGPSGEGHLGDLPVLYVGV